MSISLSTELAVSADFPISRPRSLVRHASLLALTLLIGSVAPARAAEPAAPPLLSVPRYTAPGTGQVVYFVLTDRFANGNPANDTGGIAGTPEQNGYNPAHIGFYHGGDLQGLIAKLDYIKGLGATALWTTPPFRNKPFADGTAGYHGYWILDFLHIDPHLGTDADFHQLVTEAHKRGLKVYLDIVINHTGDVVKYKGKDYTYVPLAKSPYRDAAGQPFDVKAVAFNGLNSPSLFPALSAERSFPYQPVVPPEEANAKNPAWLNNPIYYHNRGNSVFTGENSLYGDFAGLDDVFTENPFVVQGFIDIYRHWIEDFQVDGFRIDTVKHVNLEFWEAFAPAMREVARQMGKPDFIQFGEVMDGSGNSAGLSEFCRTGRLDSTIDFGFQEAARHFLSEGGDAAALASFFDKDDYYTGPDTNAQASATFLGNHDTGRFAYFLQKDNPKALPDQLARMTELGHALLLTARGLPCIYYGDEQGMIGRGGNDTHSREDMFPAQAKEFRDAKLLATTRTGADDKFDPKHPFYRLISSLATLHQISPALNHGAMILRPSGSPHIFAFSRIERNERIEYLAAFNNSATAAATVVLPTSQPAGATLKRVVFPWDHTSYPDATITADAQGRVAVTLAPLQYSIWYAAQIVPTPTQAPTIAFATPATGATLTIPAQDYYGHTFPVRQELRAEVTGNDGVAEVTFAMERSSRPGQYEVLGTDDAAPYRIYWCPPPDLAPGETLSFLATVDDLRGHRVSTRITGLKVAPGAAACGIAGAQVPVVREQPAAYVTLDLGDNLTLTARAEGTGPLYYQWLRDGIELPGATKPTLTFTPATAALSGHYRLLVRGLAGSVLSAESTVLVTPATAGRIETLPPLASRYVAARRIDVWLPPGYDTNAGERYPVVYMHDGQNIFDSATSYGGTSWEVDQAMCRLIKAGKTKGAIIVGVWNSGMGRFPEYMPRKAVTGDTLTILPGMPGMPTASIRSDAYLRYLVEEVKPAIDHAYRTLPDAAHTSVMGSSMGGLISGYALVEYPAVFGAAGCVSTHFPAGDGIVINYFAQHLPPPDTHRIYFDYGTQTLDALYEPYQLKMDAAMRAAGYTDGRDWMTRKFAGEEHSEKSWRKRVEIPLEFLLRP